MDDLAHTMASVLPTLARRAADLPAVPDLFRGWRCASATPDQANNVILFGRTRSRSSPVVPIARDYHHRHVLLVTLMGEGLIEVEGRPVSLTPGAVLRLPPFVLHRPPSVVTPTGQWLYVTFDQTPMDQGDEARFHLYTLTPETVHLLEAMLTWWNRRMPGEPGAADARSMALATTLLLERLRTEPREPEPGAGGSDPGVEAWVAPVLRRLRDLSQPPPTSAELGAAAGLSPSHLRARFRQRFGVSLGQYTRRLRIRLAISLVTRQGMTLSEAAYRCGFSSIYAFSRSAKAVLGEPPSTYVRRATQAGSAPRPRTPTPGPRRGR